MASSRSSCSSARRRRSTRSSRPDTFFRHATTIAALLLTVVVPGCHAGTSTPDPPEATHPGMPGAAQALCQPSDTGYLRAKLQGAITTEIDWSHPVTPQCLGGPRPMQDGVRLVYKGKAGTDSLLVIVGIGVGVGETVVAARNVPASVTVVREGLGEFFATQGDDKCAIDELTQEPVAGLDGRYRLSGRGYCTQPARIVGGESGSVLVSRFDVEALVDYPRGP